jgi:glucosylceramidase
MAAFSRFVRPGAVRVAVSSPHELLKVTAFENVDSTAVIELLNLSGEALHLELKIDGWPGRVHASSYVTSQDHSLMQAGVLLVSRGTISVNIAPRTLLTLVGAGMDGGAGEEVGHMPMCHFSGVEFL